MKITHFGIHTPGNAGDTVLFEEVRRVFQRQQGDLEWQNRSVRSEVTKETLNGINKNRTPVIVGGGGLILSDTVRNDNSGWQWNCPVRFLKRMSPPLAVFAVGYNKFQHQSDFGAVFRRHMRRTVEKSIFFGLRNHGSIAQLKNYLPPRLADKLKYQPCPTTFLSITHPEVDHRRDVQKRVSLNAAFDREENRFGEHKERILSSIARAMSELEKAGWTIDVVLHSVGDDKVIEYLARQNVKFRVFDLEKKSSEKILSYYSSAHIVAGMRGHSQMIPFGLNKSIVSLISHPKMEYFLDDIGHPEWGIDVYGRELADELVSKIVRYGRTEWQAVQRQVAEAMQRLSDITSQNVKFILTEFNRYHAKGTRR